MELIPTGMLTFSFLMEKDTSNRRGFDGKTLESTNRLLGIDLVRRLIADLEVLRKKKKNQTAINAIWKKSNLQKKVETLEDEGKICRWSMRLGRSTLRSPQTIGA